ncbi:uncharacterized protein SCHCODRAFT_02571132 [Schizophyllum commune H4-8]|uniref:uncharacterized protein n=1 Tax=Schizophyllum commune (strain H4-8 / FGSC 9210) TaxID=578458 RepID=UPI00215DF1EA|nr:uncharacterized protein SCHCODRAFT_02571132 [Schizophyllum commune H4-8]KAI5894585.1 hypothetical protein SCHCODRAFT_02571132 [Schizophyllum commune H4-8]
MDNATNNDTLVEEIERLCMLDGIHFSATQARLRCMPHTIHLSAIKAAIGAITRSEADKASSRTVNYQDSVTSPLDPKPNTSRNKKTPGSAAQAVEDDGDSEEEEEEGHDEQVSEQDVSTAVGKVRHTSLSLTVS